MNLHPAVADQHDRQCKEVGADFYSINAANGQSSNSRPRRLAQDIMDRSTLIGSMRHMCPSFLLDGPYHFKQHPGPCLVSKGNDTHSPPVWVKEWSCDERFAVVDERDRMQGFATGIIHGFFDTQGKPRVDVTEDFRIRLNGSSFNYDHLFVVLSA